MTNNEPRIIRDGMVGDRPQFFTGRPTAESMEVVLAGDPVPVLDHGFIRLVDYMGTQECVLQAARVSYQGGTKSHREDRGLTRYLMRKHHTTPFEMAEIKVHAKMPIFVARQWVRHRMASINEVSARYSILDKEFYIPTIESLAPQSITNKQGREGLLTERQAHHVRQLLRDDAEQAYLHYSTLLMEDREGERNRLQEELRITHGDVTPNHAQCLVRDEEFTGIARELARMNLSLNFYTQWYWKTDVKNFMDFLALRNDGHAQYEIRVYAEVMEDWFSRWMPMVYEAFQDYRRDAVTLSGPAITALREMLEGAPPDQIQTFRHRLGLRLEKREMDEVFQALGFNF